MAGGDLEAGRVHQEREGDQVSHDAHWDPVPLLVAVEEQWADLWCQVFIFYFLHILFITESYNRMTLEMSCPMDFRKYPHDNQTCFITLESCKKQIQLLWQNKN